MQMNALETMTREVITVSPDTTVGEIATLLVQHGISAVPVISADNRVIGIISQTDLGHRGEMGTEKKRKWWLDLFADADARAREYVKSHGLKASDVMTRFVVSVAKSASLAEVAELLDTHRIRQVPVMEDGKLLGMISRADLVRRLAEVKVAAPAARPENGVLQKAIWNQIKSEPWLRSSYVNIAVKDGTVELWGAVDTEEQRNALRVLVEGVSGVQKVENNVVLFPKVIAA